jgi:aminopeptidase
MRDARIDRLAGVITDYSTEVRRGDVVLISASGEECQPLLKAVHRRCLERGARYVEIQFSFPEIARDFYRYGSQRQLAHFPAHRLAFLKQVDVSIGIAAEQNAMVLAGVDQAKVLAHQRVLRPLLEWRVSKTRWVVCRFPTHGMAQQAGMSLEELEDHFFGSCNLDWAAVSRRQEPLRRLMSRADRVRIEAPDTDLSFSIRGIPASQADGRRNLPDGEVFSAPVKTSAEGHIAFNCPTIHGGQAFDDIRLTFRRGKAVAGTAADGEERLGRILDIDAGARYLGEFAFGLNPRITRPMRNILFDEKIFGSIHLALGNAYRRCDNRNRSSIHWDLVKILGAGSRVSFDGTPIMVDGRFVHPALRALNPRRGRL